MASLYDAAIKLLQKPIDDVIVDLLLKPLDGVTLFLKIAE